MEDAKLFYTQTGNYNAARELSEQERYLGKTIKVVKGRKVPIGTTGECFWVKRYDNSKYGDPWGIYSTTRVGIKTEDDETYFTDLKNIEIMEDKNV